MKGGTSPKAGGRSHAAQPVDGPGRAWPAAGPLAWLHPELALLWKAPRGALDLAGLWGAPLRGALEARPRWELPRGPLARALPAALAGTWSADAPEWLPSTAGFAGPEALLTAAVHAAPDAPAFVARVGAGAGLDVEPTSLDGDARRSGSDRADVRLLPLRVGPDLERRVGELRRIVAGAPERYRAAGCIPLFVPAQAPRSVAVPTTRLAPAWWGVLPGDEYPGALRDEFRKLLQTLWPERMLTFLAYENYACAGIDLYADAVRGRGDAAPGRASSARARVFCVSGIDGAGKSSHVAALRDYLESRGLRCAVHKLFRHGLFHETVTDLTRGCAGERRLHVWRLQRTAKVLDSLKVFATRVAADLERCDAVLFDRYTYTHLAAGRGRYHHDPWALELLAGLPRPDRVYLLDLPADEADRRIGDRSERTVDENLYMLSRYRHVLLDLADREGFLVLDARAPFEENRDRIRADVGGALPPEGGQP